MHLTARSRRLALAGIALAAGAALLAGCAGSSTPATDTDSPAAAVGGRIVWADFGGPTNESRQVAYFDGFQEIGRICRPDIALLPIGAYHPESFRNVHMGPDDALKVFRDLRAKWLVPMHYGSFRLSFEDMDEPPRWLRQLAREQNLIRKVRVLEEGVPAVF